MKKIKSYIITAIFFILFGIFITLYITNKNKLEKAFLDNSNFMQLQMPDIEKTLKKIKVTDVIVFNIQNKKDLVTMETDLTQNLTWDESFTEFDVLKKIQNMTFYGIGKYSTDLSKLTKEDIVFDYSNDIVTVVVERPKVDSIEIDEEKTIIYKTDNGFFRFGEIKLTAAEQKEIYKKTKSSMYDELNSSKLIKQAEESTITSVQELFKTFLASAEIKDLDVKVYFR